MGDILGACFTGTIGLFDSSYSLHDFEKLVISTKVWMYFRICAIRDALLIYYKYSSSVRLKQCVKYLSVANFALFLKRNTN